MSVYAIGDVQGCGAELDALLHAIGFAPPRDRLLFVGDLVNRGPDSLGVLRRVRDLGAAAECVLGNHDLHLLAVAAGVAPPKRQDTLAAVLAAPDRDGLLDWLRRRPLLVDDPASGATVLHAGLPPQWDVAQARARAREVEAALAGPGWIDLLARMYGDTPRRWRDGLAGWARLRVIVNCLTRLRYCDAAGVLALGEKGAPGSQRPPFQPWFAVPERRSRGTTIVFGHWSTLRLARADCERYRVWPLDTGCVWGERLTALRLDDWQVYSVPATSRAPRQRPAEPAPA